jgi:hypothetical protein
MGQAEVFFMLYLSANFELFTASTTASLKTLEQAKLFEAFTADS